MNNSKIAWTHDSANPIEVEGGGFFCIKVSQGCKHCYAERVNKMMCGFRHIEAYDYKHYNPLPKLALKQDMLDKWARLGRPRLIFVSSMTDVFGEFVPREFQFKILDAMCAAWKQTFQVLTKRDKLAREVIEEYCGARNIQMLPKNIWIGVSVEDQDSLSRAVNLIATRCEVKWLSMEPLLGPVCLTVPTNLTMPNGEVWYDAKIIEHLHWIVVGGESGGQARPMSPLIPESIERTCRMYKVPFFFKQWGEWVGGVSYKGDIYLQDGGKLVGGYGGHPFIEYNEPVAGDESKQWVSVRVGRKARQLYENRKCIDANESDNELYHGSYAQEFPPYYKEDTVSKNKK